MDSPPPENTFRDDLYWALYSADQNLGFCLLSFPLGTFSGALLVGLWGSLSSQMKDPSLVPFWIIGLGFCVLFSVWPLFAVRSARRGYAKLGMPPREIRRRISAMWIGVAIFMMLAASCVLVPLAVTRGQAVYFGPIDDPLPLTVTCILYFVAAALLLGRSWRDLRSAGSTPELRADEVREAGREAQWARILEIYAANMSSIGMGVFMIGMTFLALMVGLGNGSQSSQNAGRLVIIGLFALSSLLGVLGVRRSRRHFEAAGFSQEAVQRQMAFIWRSAGIWMTLIGAGALIFAILAFDVLTPADQIGSLGSALGYTSTGLILFWWNRRKRGA